MTDQSNSAAERSAHVHRGDALSPADWPVVKMPDGTWKLKSVLALENRIETLEAALNEAKQHFLADEPLKAFVEICAALIRGEDE